MSLSTIANISDLIAAIGIIVTLGFVAYELRQGNKQARMANVRAQLEAFQCFRGRTGEQGLADIILRGRANYSALSNEEQLIFADYLLQGIFTAMTMRIHSGHGMLSDEQSQAATIRHIRDIMDYPGPRTWWEENRDTTVLAALGRTQVDKALGRTDI